MNKDFYGFQDPLHRSLDNYCSIQKEPKDYYLPDYLSPKRLSSYGYQYNLSLRTGCQSFLNIGSSNHLLRLMLHSQNLQIIETDIDLNTIPNISTALPFLPFRDKSFDVVLCFQVLEHLPFNLFSICLKEMSRVSGKYLIISLPDRTKSKRQTIKRLIYHTLKHPSEWKKYKINAIAPEHFWEIGHANVNVESIIKSIKTEELELVEHFRNPLFDYHHFFFLKVNSSSSEC